MKPHKRERLLLILALGSIGVLAADKLIFTPLGKLWSDRSDRILSLQSSVDRGEHLLDRESGILNRWQSMQQSALPQDASAAEEAVLKAAIRWERISGVSLTSFNPQWIEEKDFQNYVCPASVNGDLQSMMRFLFELETDALPIRAEKIELTSIDDSGNKLRLILRFSALSFKENSE